MEKFQKIIINTYIIINLLYLFPWILLSVISIFKGDIVYYVLLLSYVVSFIALSVLIFTERYKNHINTIIFIILTLSLIAMYYCSFVFAIYLDKLYGIGHDIQKWNDFFINGGYKNVVLSWDVFFAGLIMDIKNFFPSIRDELILQILLISDIVGSSMLIYREVGVYRERKK
jgi:hypothetical protein